MSRARVALLVSTLLGLALGTIWLVPDSSGQTRMMQTYAALVVAGLVLGAWLLAGLERRWFWRAVVVLGLTAVVVVALVRVRGVTGDFLPVLDWRWSSPPRAAVAPPLPPPVTAPAPPSELAEPASEPTPAEEPTPAPAGLRTQEDHPQFLGPRRDATWPHVRLDRDWSARPPRLVWRRPIGPGWSGFAIAGGLAITQEQDGALERVVAYDLASGEPRWSQADEARYHTVVAGEGPRATPALAGGRVFTLGATGLLNAFELQTGRRLWHRDIVAETGAAPPDWGRSCSPLLVNGRVVVSAGGPDGRSLLAYDAATGELAWSAGSDGVSYSSPRLVTLGGQAQVVILNGASVAGHDPASGRLLWEHPFPGGQPNVAAPAVLSGDRLLVSVGYGIGSRLYAVSTDGARLSWESPRLKSKFANLVVHGEHVYGLDDGVLTCLDPASGERLWKAGRYGHGQLLLIGDLLLVQTEEGELVLVEARPDEPRELGRFPALEGKTWNPPAFAPPYLLVRHDREAALYELPLLR